MADPVRIVFDVHLYVLNLTGADAQRPVVVEVPPGSGNASADCLSIIFDNPGVYALYASPHIVGNTARVLRQCGLDEVLVRDYLNAVREIIFDSGGDVRDPGHVFDLGSPDHEGNHVLALALAVDADVIVSDDTDLTPMSPWRGCPIIRPRQFVERFVNARRH
ncbi:MAG: hypothetical protein FWD74_04930 [Actinomycetia bacterium]|nr:hypothetical protein [Actinomycetes bacterium]